MKTLNIFGTPSIRRRISSAFVILTLFVLVMVTASYFQLRRVKPSSDIIIQDSGELVDIQRLSTAVSALDGDMERFLTLRGIEYKESVEKELQEMADILAGLQADPDTSQEIQGIVSELGNAVTELQTKVDKVFNSIDSSSSTDINRSVISLYQNIDQIKELQEKLSTATLTSLQTTAQAQGSIADNVLTQSVVLGIIVSLIAIVTTVVTDRRLRTISTLTNTATAITAGDLSQVAPVESNDEIGTLAGAFNKMTSQQRELIGSLEARVAARTQDLATVAEVGTATATILETDKLLQAVVDLTKERFNLYHSHIYLLDEAGENLVLASGAGEPGRQMVAEGRSIPLNREQSLVARAARERKGVTVNDVTQASDFLPNPLLPDTRSELAVPMIVGEKVIGVFDIQSDQVGHFTESDVNIQTTLASQVATSIQNVRSFEQSKSQADLESLVNAIGQKIQRATTVEDTLQTAIREVGLALGATRVSANIQASRQFDGDKVSRN